MRRRDRNIVYDPAYDYYDLIGVEPDAPRELIQRAYRRRAKEVHPDTNPDRREWATAQFKRLVEAYHVLSDPSLRSAYDKARWPHQTFEKARPRPPEPGSPPPTYTPPPNYEWVDDSDSPLDQFGRWLMVMWQWRAALIGVVVGAGLLSLLFYNLFLAATDPGPHAMPKPAFVSRSAGCQDGIWSLATPLTLKVDPEAFIPRAVLVNGSAVVEFTLALYAANGDGRPLYVTPPLSPVRSGFLGELNAVLMHGARYFIILEATADPRPPCVVTFDINS